MITKEQVPEVIGHTAYDRSHHKLGKVGDVYLDSETGMPEWFTVRTGMFGTKESFVPLQPAEMRGDEIVVPFPQEQIKEAPRIDTDGGNLPPEDEIRLYEHYGMAYESAAGRGTTGTTEETAPGTATGQPEPGTPAATAGPVAGAPRGTAPGDGAPADDDAMTRSEEHLRVGTERRQAGRARLRKYVETEYEQHTVPVRRERVRVEHEPITEENRDRAMAGPEITEAEHEMVLEEERPVVGKETRPVERVRMEKEALEQEETIGGEVRRERIETEGVEDTGDASRASADDERRYER